MAERKGSHRTVRGLELERGHDERYKKMLIGKTNEHGKITDAKFIGNSVAGIVEVYFEDGTTHLYSHGERGFRPRKQDFKLIDTTHAKD